MVLIRPKVGMYAAFARLNYRPWYALAEFVDNSIQSALANRDALANASGKPYRLSVEIELKDDAIEIRDNAGGIAASDYERAFLPASPPVDTSGLSEFGLGLKAAACWFSRKWSVRTTALGDPVERTISFDVPHIIENNCEQLEPMARAVGASEHYTTISLYDLQQRPKGRTVGKIRDHLRSIYRLFIRDGVVDLRFNGELLEFTPPVFLVAPFHRHPVSEPVKWRKEIDLDLGEGHRIRGWAGILERSSSANAGFAIFRRRRLIQGSYGEAYRPGEIFGKPNTFVSQRVIGELEVEGFRVSHTKDGVQWDDWEEEIISWLKDELDKEPLPLLNQARNYRATTRPDPDFVGAATHDTSTVLVQHLPPVLEAQLEAEPDETELDRELTATEEPGRSHRVEMQLEHAHQRWSITIEVVSDPGRDEWYEVTEGDLVERVKSVGIRINLAHPFLERFISPDGDELIPFTRMAAGLAIAEITARKEGARQAGTIRRNLNEILRSALSGPIEKKERGE